MGNGNSVWMLGVWDWKLGKAEGRTADPSATLGMTKGRVVFSGKVGEWLKETALGFGSTAGRDRRDDNSVCSQKVQGPLADASGP
jgi:hypothetical protein